MAARTLVKALFTGCILSSVAVSADAASIDGAWASPGDACDKVFVRSGKGISFAPEADMYGSGFIIRGNQVQGKMANCKVNARKRDGLSVQVTAACSTSIAVESIQFMLKKAGENKITRMYPGLPELNTDYDRCNF